jgi:hypothetical protein
VTCDHSPLTNGTGPAKLSLCLGNKDEHADDFILHRGRRVRPPTNTNQCQIVRQCPTCQRYLASRRIFAIIFVQTLVLKPDVISLTKQFKTSVRKVSTILGVKVFYFYRYFLSLKGSESLPPRHGASSGCEWRNGLQIWRVAANILNKQLRRPTRGGPPAWGLGEVLTNPHQKNLNMLQNSQTSLEFGQILRYSLSGGKEI